MEGQSIDRIREVIERNDGFSILAHISPDGDTLGSSLALYQALVRLGKRAQVISADNVPEIYRFLPCWDEIKRPEDAPVFENVIAVDCADQGRMGGAFTHFEQAKRTINIDHHVTNDGYAEHNAIDPGAAAAGELIFSLVDALLKGDIPVEIATCLYVALMTDTGNFAYSNTAPSTFRMAARLLELGVDNCDANRRVYRMIPFHKKMLLGIALRNIRRYGGKRIAISHVMRMDLASVAASPEDTEGIIDHLRDIKGVEVAFLMHEVGDEEYKVSMRSKFDADVGVIAQRLGGGGHRNAAGCTLKGSRETLRQCLIGLTIQALEDRP